MHSFVEIQNSLHMLILVILPKVIVHALFPVQFAQDLGVEVSDHLLEQLRVREHFLPLTLRRAEPVHVADHALHLQLSLPTEVEFLPHVCNG